MKIQIIAIIVACSIIYSCQRSSENNQIIVNECDSLPKMLVADTIITEAIIRVSDSTDIWQKECLKDIKKDDFVDTLFNLIYSEKLIAYDYQTNQALSISKVKEIEEKDDFKRELVGKIIFNETWKYNSTNNIFTKKVHSMTFGYEVFTTDGIPKGYAPMFKVYTN